MRSHIAELFDVLCPNIDTEHQLYVLFMDSFLGQKGWKIKKRYEEIAAVQADIFTWHALI